MRAGVRLPMAAFIVVMLAPLMGCGGTHGPAETPAGKPPTLPPVGDSSGTIFYYDNTLGQVRSMAWDGSNPQQYQVAGVEPGFNFDVSHATTNRYMIYRNSSSKQLCIQTLDAAVTTPIYGDGATFGAMNPCLSRDDTMVSFVHIVYATRQWASDGNWVADIVYQGGLPVALANARQVAWVSDYTAMLSPLKDAFAQQAVAGTRFDIFVVNVATGATRNITNSAKLDEFGPDWSPALAGGGSRIAFACTLLSNGGSNRVGYDIWTTLPDGSSGVKAISKTNSGVAWNVRPVWSPDGNQIIFLGKNKESDTVYAFMRSAADGSTTAAQLTGFTLNPSSVVWVP